MSGWVVGALRWLRGRRRRWMIVGLAAVGVDVATGPEYAVAAGGSLSPAATSTVEVDRGEVPAAIAITGTLEPADARSFSFSIAGTITRVNVRPDEPVSPASPSPNGEQLCRAQRLTGAADFLGAAAVAARARASASAISMSGTECVPDKIPSNLEASILSPRSTCVLSWEYWSG